MTEKKQIPRKAIVIAVVATLALCSVSFFLGSRSGAGSVDGGADTEIAKATTYYCSMHPHIRSPAPGKCPICGMDLIPLADEGADPGPRAIEISASAMKLADIETARVERRAIEKQVRLVGKVEFDETRVKTITAWVPGRLERLYVDYTGVTVKPGDHVVDIYSPELYSAQQELLEAKKSVKRMATSDSPLVRESTQRTLESVREKLRLWGLGAEQIQAIESQDTPSDRILINTPLGGVVVSRMADQGDYVKTGSPIYKIADLSRLWIFLDAYESDLVWLRYGQAVGFTTESYPGEIFQGVIEYIDWVVAHTTRTVKIRVSVDNTDGRLKPGMFVRAKISARLGEGGHVMDPSLAGKWICTMHPDVVAAEAGDCPACGMDLVPAEQVFSVTDNSEKPPLVIPVSAPLLTGKRAVVYVKLPDREKPTFEGREIVVGPRSKDYYVVLSGLEENEEVVVRGNFKIDSALQIQAKPSMMNPDGGGSGGAHQHGGHEAAAGPATEKKDAMRFASTPDLLLALDRLLATYLDIHRGLATDDLATASAGFVAFGAALGTVPADSLESDAEDVWRELARTGGNEVIIAARSSSLEELRDAFRNLSRAMRHVEHRFGHSDGAVLREAYCPMAFDGQGAVWLQREEEISNPFLGQAMPRCGEIRATYPSLTRERLTSVSTVLQEDIARLYDHYLPLQRALAGDALKDATTAAAELRRFLDGLKRELPPEVAEAWHQSRRELSLAADGVAEAGSLDSQREHFERVSKELTSMLRKFGHGSTKPVREMHCPMAFDNRGANWLQDTEEVANPYFGAMMLRCGDQESVYPAAPPSSGSASRPSSRPTGGAGNDHE